MTLFPPAATEAEFDQLTRVGLLPAVSTLLEKLGIDDDIVPFAEGSLPVYAVGEQRVLKLYPPVYADEITVERTMLEVLHGRLPVRTPGVENAGTHQGWGYLGMERFPGVTLAEAWPGLSTEDKHALAPVLGETLAALHHVDDPRPTVLGPPDWSEFIENQRGRALEHHRATKLPEHWLTQIPEFLENTDLPNPPPVPLHTEFMREHVMVTRAGDGWRACGLFDFEPSMRGAAEYDFAATGLFVSGGDASLLRHFLLAYGYRADELGDAFARRCLAYTLLHVYSNVHRYLEILPVPPESTLDTLAKTRWRTD